MMIKPRGIFFVFLLKPRGMNINSSNIRRSSAIASCLCLKTDGIGSGHKFLYADFEVVETRLVSNCGEFAIIKIWIVEILPDA